MSKPKVFRCPECGSTELEIEDVDVGEEAEMECNDCGYTDTATRLPADKLF